jgi:serine/threonine-protein kinase
METQRGIAARVTVHAANDWDAIWSPDSRRILFGSDRAGGPSLEAYTKASVDTGDVEAPFFPKRNPDSWTATDWSRDGRWVAFTKNKVSRGDLNEIWVASALGDRDAFPFLATSFDQAAPRFSPDAKWIAYISNESGQYEVYVRPFAGRTAGTDGKIRISAEGGDFPVWSRDGKELFYMSGDRQLHAVSMAGLGRTAPVPSTLFNACNTTGVPLQGNSYMIPYDVAPDGRFLIECTTADPGKFEVLLNWNGR